MAVGGAMVWFFPVSRFVDVAETLPVRRKREAPQIAPGKNIRQSSPAFDVQKLEGSRAFPALFDLEEQQPAVRRNMQGFHRRVFSRTAGCCSSRSKRAGN